MSNQDNVEYLLIQLVEDLFRRESRNIGVVVRKQGNVAARFLGESAEQSIDGRKIKTMAAPEVYRQWIEYWRRVLVEDPDPFGTIVRSQRGNYVVLEGGNVGDTGGDPPDDVADFLFRSLVAPGGGLAEPWHEAETDEERQAAAPKLNRELAQAFRAANLLAYEGDQPSLIRAPILHRAPLKGSTSVPHRPEFQQQNGRVYVMETLDLLETAQIRVRDHAGYITFMFGDLKESLPGKVETIAVVRMDPASTELEEHARYGLSVVRKEASKVVNWVNSDERAAFLEDRRKVALAG